MKIKGECYFYVVFVLSYCRFNSKKGDIYRMLYLGSN